MRNHIDESQRRRVEKRSEEPTDPGHASEHGQLGVQKHVNVVGLGALDTSDTDQTRNGHDEHGDVSHNCQT